MKFCAFPDSIVHEVKWWFSHSIENVFTKKNNKNEFFFSLLMPWYTCNSIRLTIALLTTHEKLIWWALDSFAELIFFFLNNFVLCMCVWEKLAERCGFKSFPFVNTYFKFWNYKQTFRIINWKIAWFCWFRTFAHWLVDADVVVVVVIFILYHRNINNTMYYYFWL